MLDIAVAYNRYIFIGQEFLTWLWFISENQDRLFPEIHPEMGDLRLGNRIVLQNRYGDDRIETLTIKGDTAGLEEGMVALQKGAVVTELHMILVSGDHEWIFTLKGEHLGFSGLKTPDTGHVTEKDELEGAIIEKVFLIQKAFEFIDSLFNYFIKIRTSEKWKDHLLEIRNWVKRESQTRKSY
ncbi:hypothetical protein [Desulfobotulus sp.]|jgi:hypothetical protein|uniref:hypothetical protein n=1 Tax=Desulfobotulus sp. TaxID=1940337 RepID=UPI002A359143|nr:hypothetical protein [Desulfobotulus sp.]MDY0163465.1 hypothetical protein [Desulfobotulus sp.]